MWVAVRRAGVACWPWRPPARAIVPCASRRIGARRVGGCSARGWDGPMTAAYLLARGNLRYAHTFYMGLATCTLQLFTESPGPTRIHGTVRTAGQGGWWPGRAEARAVRKVKSPVVSRVQTRTPRLDAGAAVAAPRTHTTNRHDAHQTGVSNDRVISNEALILAALACRPRHSAAAAPRVGCGRRRAPPCAR